MGYYFKLIQTTTTQHLLMERHIHNFRTRLQNWMENLQLTMHEHRLQLQDQTTTTPHLLMDKHIYNLRTRLQN